MYLKVFTNRSELSRPDGTTEVFEEGPPSENTKVRYKKIRDVLADGYLDSQIRLCKESPGSLSLERLSEEHVSLLDDLVSSMGSEVGRALIGLTILQLCVKSIEPKQSIRLHKGGTSASNFSWREGISMRSLDRSYITPVLRKNDLLRLNADGFMMTRSLAENYPYSTVYKARIRGARSQWTAIVEGVEQGHIEPEIALRYLLSQLINKASEFRLLGASTQYLLKEYLSEVGLLDKVTVAEMIRRHILDSDYRARIMEISMHSLMQAIEESDALEGNVLRPLSQMRSANKKHGNVGDIEVLDGAEIVESWDAKYGKTYLRDELDELDEKLTNHPSIRVAGFVTNEAPGHLTEIEERRIELEDVHGIPVRIVQFEDWVNEQFLRALQTGLNEEDDLASRWLSAYVESLSLKRLQTAPIDEPCHQWLASLKLILEDLDS